MGSRGHSGRTAGCEDSMEVRAKNMGSLCAYRAFGHVTPCCHLKRSHLKTMQLEQQQ